MDETIFQLNKTNPGVGFTEGKCECCEERKLLTKHHIVPYAFSRHFDQSTFPDNFLNVCRECHDLIEIDLRKFRKFFRGRLGITTDDLRQSDQHIRYKKAKAFAWQLVSNHGNIPNHKIMEMTVYIVKLYPNAYTYDDFRKIARDDTKINETRTDPYGKVVADKIRELGMEDWFAGVWKRKNRAVIRKLRAKGIEQEHHRKRSRKHYAPEADKYMVVTMLMSTEKMAETEALSFYNSQDSDVKLSLRRCAFAWNKRKLKEAGLVDEATKLDTCKFLAESLGLSIETATETYRMSSKRKKKSYRRQAFEHTMKKKLSKTLREREP